MTINTLDGTEAYKIEACKGYGCIPATFMFVGISAGKLGALKTEVPFTRDMSGRLLQRVLFRLDLSRSPDEKTWKPELKNCYLTNLVKGRILNDEGNNRLPTSAEIAYWIPKLNHEILDVKPKFIIALGDLVFKSLVSYKMCGALLTNEAEIIYAKHPRAYGSRGAVSESSAAWRDMLYDYRKMIETLQFRKG